jgi:hypothetical protein
MTNAFTRIVIANITAVLIGLSAVPSHAAGQISFGFSPNDPEQAQALGMGLQLVSIFNGTSRSGASIFQNGNGNSAGGSQTGAGNHGLIWQQGDGHSGTVHQSGNNNSCGLFQFGTATNGQCVQSGNDQSGITTVFGF